MAYDEHLAHRIRAALSGRRDVTEKKMFGGLAFMVGDHMCCGIVGDDLMVRVGAEAHQKALAAPHARPMDFTGRAMKGMVYVAPEGTKTSVAVRRWVDKGLAYATSLPPKRASAAPKPMPSSRARRAR